MPVVNHAVIGLFWFLFKVSSIIYLLIWFRGTFPRFRYDQLMNIGWKIAIPVGMAAVLINAIIGMLRHRRKNITADAETPRKCKKAKGASRARRRAKPRPAMLGFHFQSFAASRRLGGELRFVLTCVHPCATKMKLLSFFLAAAAMLPAQSIQYSEARKVWLLTTRQSFLCDGRRP